MVNEETVFIRRLIKMGHSKGITIPPYILRLWEWKFGEVRKVKIEVKDDGALVITPLVIPNIPL